MTWLLLTLLSVTKKSWTQLNICDWVRFSQKHRKKENVSKEGRLLDWSINKWNLEKMDVRPENVFKIESAHISLEGFLFKCKFFVQWTRVGTNSAFLTSPRWCWCCRPTDYTSSNNVFKHADRRPISPKWERSHPHKLGQGKKWL